jgi:type III secretion protein J
MHNRVIHSCRLALLVTLLVFLSACKEQIVHNLSEAEANRYLTKLQEIHIDASKVRQADARWAIAVESESALAAVKYLEEARLFREQRSAHDKSALVSSREDQRFQYERAISIEIENTLNGIEGVLDARVHLNLPQVDPIFGQPLPGAKGSGSVLMITRGALGSSKEEIAALVSGASGIEQARISVLVSNTATLNRLPTAAPLVSVATPLSIPSQMHAYSVNFYQIGSGLAALVLIFLALWFRRSRSPQLPRWPQKTAATGSLRGEG